MFHLMNVASICLTIQLQLFFWDMMSYSQSVWRSTLKMCKVISNSDIKLPAHQRQPLSLYHYHHCPATHCHCQAPWPMPGQACRPQQSHAPLSPAAPMLPAPATILKIMTMAWEGGRRWVHRRGKDTRRITTTQHATHMPHCLFILFSVIWWCGMQPTCHIIYFFHF